MPRKKPYTAAGIRRVPCIRCGAPGHASWHICADNNRMRVLCKCCDIALNERTMLWAFGDNAETRRRIDEYVQKVEQQP